MNKYVRNSDFDLLKATYKVFFTETAYREFQRLDKTIQKKVNKAILKFYENPFQTNTEKLTQHPEAQYRHRIGNWRILFDLLPGNIIHILHVWPRGKEYKK